MSSPLAPRLWGVHLLGMVCVTVATLLGFWQLESWQAVREAEARDLSEADPIGVTEVYGPDEPFPADHVGRPVEISGTWVSDVTLFISGRAEGGTDGYWVVTPLAIGPADAPALPVVRGWVAEPPQAPEAPTGSGDLVGYLQPGEGTGEMDDDPTDDVLPQLRVADVIQHVDQDLYEGYVIARDGVGGLPAADLGELPKVGAMSGLRNFLYAVEWWLFGLFAGYVWWRYVRETTAEQEQAPPADRVASGTE